MDQAKIISYAMQEVLRRWDKENTRTLSTRKYHENSIAVKMANQYSREYDELKEMLLKAGEEVTA